MLNYIFLSILLMKLAVMSSLNAEEKRDTITPESKRIVFDSVVLDTDFDQRIFASINEPEAREIEKTVGTSIKVHGEYILPLSEKLRFLNYVKILIERRDDGYVPDEVAEYGIYGVLYDAWYAKLESKGSDIKAMVRLLLWQEYNMHKLLEYDDTVETDSIKQSLIDQHAAYCSLTGLNMGIDEFRNYISDGCVLTEDMKGEFKERLIKRFDLLIKTRLNINKSAPDVSVDRLLIENFINRRFNVLKAPTKTADSDNESSSTESADDSSSECDTADDSLSEHDTSDDNSSERDTDDDSEPVEKLALSNTKTDGQTDSVDAEPEQYDW